MIKLPRVSYGYCGPLGRLPDRVYFIEPHKVRLQLMPLDSGGYDQGGAYWGINGTGRMYVAEDIATGALFFTRNSTRELAIQSVLSPWPNAILRP